MNDARLNTGVNKGNFQEIDMVGHKETGALFRQFDKLGGIHPAKNIEHYMNKTGYNKMDHSFNHASALAVTDKGTGRPGLVNIRKAEGTHSIYK